LVWGAWVMVGGVGVGRVGDGRRCLVWGTGLVAGRRCLARGAWVVPGGVWWCGACGWWQAVFGVGRVGGGGRRCLARGAWRWWQAALV
jgi:hypothetical protein